MDNNSMAMANEYCAVAKTVDQSKGYLPLPNRDHDYQPEQLQVLETSPPKYADIYDETCEMKFSWSPPVSPYAFGFHHPSSLILLRT